MKWLKDILTDNEGDFDVVSVMAAVSVAVLCGLTIYLVVQKEKDFQLQDFGIAVAAIVGAAGGGYWAKSSSYGGYRPPRYDYRSRDHEGPMKRTDDIE